MPLLGKLANWCGGSRRVFVKQLWSFTKRGNDPKLTGHLNLISFTCPAKVKHTKRAHGTNPQVTVAQSSLSPKWMNVVYSTINLPKCPIFHMLGVLPRKYVYYDFYHVLSHLRSLNNQPLLSPGCFDLATARLQLRMYLHASPPGPNLRPSQVASPWVDLGEGKRLMDFSCWFTWGKMNATYKLTIFIGVDDVVVIEMQEIRDEDGNWNCGMQPLRNPEPALLRFFGCLPMFFCRLAGSLCGFDKHVGWSDAVCVSRHTHIGKAINWKER